MNEDKRNGWLIKVMFALTVVGILIMFLVCSGCTTVNTLANSAKGLQMPNMKAAMVIQQNPTVLNDPKVTVAPTPTIDVNATAAPTPTKPKFVYV